MTATPKKPSCIDISKSLDKADLAVRDVLSFCCKVVDASDDRNSNVNMPGCELKPARVTDAFIKGLNDVLSRLGSGLPAAECAGVTLAA